MSRVLSHVFLNLSLGHFWWFLFLDGCRDGVQQIVLFRFVSVMNGYHACPKGNH